MITFSFKEKKKPKEEKYSFPVLTQLPYLGGKNVIAKFQLNKAALEALGYPIEDLRGSSVSVAREEETKMIALVNTTGQLLPNQYNVNKDGSVNSQFLLNRLIKQKGIDCSEEHEFQLYVNEEEHYVTIGDAPVEVISNDENEGYMESPITGAPFDEDLFNSEEVEEEYSPLI